MSVRWFGIVSLGLGVALAIGACDVATIDEAPDAVVDQDVVAPLGDIDGGFTPDGTGDLGGDLSPDSAMDIAPDAGPDGSQDIGPDVVPSIVVIDQNCADGLYTEALPPGSSVDLGTLLASYNPANYKAWIDSVLSVRYPTGAWLVKGGLTNQNFGDCIDTFLDKKATGADIIGQLSTLVHECGHFYDIGTGGFSEAAYQITPTVQKLCAGASYSGPNSTFARSRITGDAWAKLNPVCPEGVYSGCDFYANIYLNGDPDDGMFDGGDQGFDSVLEETTQYVNSLATAYAFNDYYASTVSERDGILTFLWYVERYLHMARNDYPADYEVMAGSQCWRDAILTVWGRAWIYLDATDAMPQLGISDAMLMDLVMDPTLLGEIQRLRDRHGCK